MSFAIARLLLSVATFAWSAGTVAATDGPTIPLCPGLQIVTAISRSAGDYESIKTIRTVSDSEVVLRYSTEMKDTDLFATGSALLKLDFDRVMLVADLRSATDYQQVYLDKAETRIPGTTSIGTSTAVLQNLKTRGKTAFGYSAASGGLALSSDRKKYPNYYSYLQRGTLQRVGGGETLAVLVNDVVVELPIVRAQGQYYGDKVEFSFLDDAANPLALAFRIGIDGLKPLTADEAGVCAAAAKNGDTPPTPLHCDKPKGGDRDVMRVTRIAFPCSAGGALETALANRQKIDVYSIYFTFDSDALRDESTPTLTELAGIMTRHPDWRLAVNGHTDGVGGDQYNADLSKRRAAAVVTALAGRFHIDAGRLKSAGFGKSQPKDGNDTLEGRARNRRVELMRF